MIYVKKYTEYFYVNVYFKTLIFFKQLLQKNPFNHACQPHIKMFPGVNPALTDCTACLHNFSNKYKVIIIY